MTPKPYKPPTQEEYERWLARFFGRFAFVSHLFLALSGLRWTIESITMPLESDANGPIGAAFDWFTHYAIGPLMLTSCLSSAILLHLDARRLKKQAPAA